MLRVQVKALQSNNATAGKIERLMWVNVPGSPPALSGSSWSEFVSRVEKVLKNKPNLEILEVGTWSEYAEEKPEPKPKLSKLMLPELSVQD